MAALAPALGARRAGLAAARRAAGRAARRAVGPAARRAAVAAAAAAAAALGVALLVVDGQRGLRFPPAFLQAAEWPDQPRLSSEDALPLITDVALDVSLGGLGEGRKSAGKSGRGSFIADFGVMDVPALGTVRARAGLRYSELFPKGALELGVRKELRRDESRSYELSLDMQSAGDDRRLDFAAELGVRKYFKGAWAFYRLLWGLGGDRSNSGNGWNDIGAALGVTQQDMPPYGRGELTVGWRTGLLDGDPQGVAHPSLGRRAAQASQTAKKRTPVAQLDSTPYASYGVAVPVPGLLEGSARLSMTYLPQHRVVEHELRMRIPAGGSGAAAASVLVEQSTVEPSRARLRLGANFVRG